MKRTPTKQAIAVAARANLIRKATSDGATSAHWGDAYNPYAHDPQLALAWLQGYRGVLAGMGPSVKSAPPPPDSAPASDDMGRDEG